MVSASGPTALFYYNIHLNSLLFMSAIITYHFFLDISIIIVDFLYNLFFKALGEKTVLFENSVIVIYLFTNHNKESR